MTALLWVAAVVLGLAATLAAGFTAAFRLKWRPFLDAVRRFNRSVLNPRRMRDAGRPGAAAALVRHVGRRSGAEHATPIEVVPTGDGFVVALPYGPGADWVRNVLAAGAAVVEHEGRVRPVDRPEVVAAAQADPLFPPGQRRLHRLFGVRDFLRVRLAAPAVEG